MRMRILLASAVIAVFVLFSSYTWYPGSAKGQSDSLLRLIVQHVNDYHYQPLTIDDAFSEELFDQYLETLDYYKRFLTKEDLDQLAPFRTKLDDEIEEGSTEMFDLSVKIFHARVDEVEGYVAEILDQPFDFSIQETYISDPEHEAYAVDEDALRDRWRILLKYQTLSRYSDMISRQEKADKEAEGYEEKSPEEMEKAARELVLKSQESYFKRIRKVNVEDRRTEYINAALSIYDPHTGYFPPKNRTEFNIEMSGKLEGIGARLSPEDGNIKVVYIVPGSASAKQGELAVNDLIIKVAQEEDEVPVEVVGMDLDDAIQLIRGPKGSLVRLTVKKIDGRIIEIPIVRDVVEIEESFAKSAILEKGDGLRIGYIDLPSFYFDFEDRNGRRCATDIKEEIEKLKTEGVDGIVIDLRDNLGGSLSDVVEMSGYFIDRGPMVQVRSKEGRPQILSDNNPSILYDGPLVIMINSFSASASEIMAAALQDYDRAIVVGTTSYGKGTVQRFVGDVKMTIQKFYRINGGATQQRGVVPDIILPDQYSKLEIGEREQAHSMDWDEIPAISYKKWQGMPDRQMLLQASETRRASSSQWQAIEENAARLKARQDQKSYPLDLVSYQEEQKVLEEESKLFRDMFKEIEGVTASSPRQDASFIGADSVRTDRYERWYKDLQKDPYVYEVMNILGDMK